MLHVIEMRGRRRSETLAASGERIPVWSVIWVVVKYMHNYLYKSEGRVLISPRSSS